MHLLKFIFFWPIAIIQGIVLFPIHIIVTLFSKKGCLLELARRRDSLGIQMLISQGYNINEKNVYGHTPLHGVFFDRAEDSINPFMTISVLELLISEGADINAVDKRNWSPLLYAIGADYTNESIYLINTKKILLNKQFYEGRTALHYAVIKNNAKIVKSLLEKGANPEVRDNFDLTPVQYCKDKKISELFIKEQQSNTAV